MKTLFTFRGNVSYGYSYVNILHPRLSKLAPINHVVEVTLYANSEKNAKKRAIKAMLQDGGTVVSIERVETPATMREQFEKT